MTQALLTRSVDFGLGFFEHPHPQVHSELLVSGRLSLAVARTVWDRAPRAAALAARLAQVPAIRLVGDDPMRQSIDSTAHRLGTPGGPGIQVQTSRLALELVRNGWHLKPIHRLMVTSETYRRSSAIRTAPPAERPLRSPPARTVRRPLDARPEGFRGLARARGFFCGPLHPPSKIMR